MLLVLLVGGLEQVVRLFRRWRVRRECNRAAREWEKEREQREWVKGW